MKSFGDLQWQKKNVQENTNKPKKTHEEKRTVIVAVTTSGFDMQPMALKFKY